MGRVGAGARFASPPPGRGIGDAGEAAELANVKHQPLRRQGFDGLAKAHSLPRNCTRFAKDDLDIVPTMLSAENTRR